jgi:hypothetical protein
MCIMTDQGIFNKFFLLQDLQFYYDLEKQVADSDRPSEIARKIASKEIQIPIKRKIPKVTWNLK